MRLTLLAMAAAIAACSSGSATPAPTPPVAAPVAQHPAPPPPATIPHYVDQLHGAMFEGEALDNCIDLARVFEGPLPAHWTPASSIEGVLPLDPKHGEIAIRRPCDEQFDMKPLATCRVTRPKSAGIAYRLESRIFYYRYATAIESEVNMKDCLAAGGDWQAVAMDSREALRARNERRMGQALGLARASDELVKQLESLTPTRGR